MTEEGATFALKLTDEMKRRGVRSFSAGGVTVEFEPPQPELPKSTKPAERPEDEKCRCGHHLHDEHMNGLCIRNCDPTKCAPPEGAG